MHGSSCRYMHICVDGTIVIRLANYKLAVASKPMCTVHLPIVQIPHALPNFLISKYVAAGDQWNMGIQNWMLRNINEMHFVQVFALSFFLAVIRNTKNYPLVLPCDM